VRRRANYVAVMHDDRRLVEARITRELHERLMPAMYRHSMPMAAEAWEVPGEPVPFADAAAATFAPVATGYRWSRPWGTTWFRFTADVPEDWVGRQLEAFIDLGFGRLFGGDGFQAEGLVYSDTGVPLQGVHPRRTGVPLPVQGPGPLTLIVEAAANPRLGPGFRPSHMGARETAGDAPLYRLGDVLLCQRDETVFQLLLDIEVLDGVMRALPETDTRRRRLLHQLETALDAIDLADTGGTAAHARELLQPAMFAMARDGAHNVVAVGHAHIDSAWLWPLRETVRKCARTFASATRLMDDYPEYTFVCSQAAQYEWIQHRHPELFERIRERAGRGQWIPVGGMWVEPDMNLPSGESLARQIVYGQRYFAEHFGAPCREVWIPDVFGYPGSLPQLFRAGGLNRFVTQKLSWNKQNVFPHSSFLWRGIDGSEVLAHFPPVDTYNARVVADEFAHAASNFKDAAWSDWSLMPFGHGNGGGGPTREMVERARRMADLDGLPRVAPGTPDEFFGHVEREIASGAAVPVWTGELYFETHRGTLTSQSATKVGNRRCERLLREAELWWASAPGGTPRAIAHELERLWKDVLLQQFHDILPGSSIAWVHDDAEAEHTRVATRLEAIVEQALAAVAAGPSIANAATSARREVVVVDGTAMMVEVPGLGVSPLRAVPCDEAVVVTESSMANHHLAVRWDLDGRIVSIIDIARGRELIPGDEAIECHLAPDQPVEYDAWDLESWTHRRHRPVGGPATISLVQHGPLAATLRVERDIGRASHLRQDITLRAGSARLDIHCTIGWHENERLLSMMVPLDVHSHTATCDVQFGVVARPTHTSTSWDAAKFEVCAHRFVDVAEPSFGVAVLNDGRYGHNVQQGGVRVSLLRAANYPDPDADRGRHEVTIAVLPHGPGLHAVLAEAEALNLPLRIVEGAAAAVAPPLVSVSHAAVQVSSVKNADDGSGDVIVRLYEATGDRATCVVRHRHRIDSAATCDLMEAPLDEVHVGDGIVELTLRPFQLLTLRLRIDDARKVP
jgi:alpha-mannosidase